MKRPRSIKWVIIILFTVFSTLPVALLGLVVLHFTAQSLEHEINSKNLLLSKIFINQIERYLDEPLKDLGALKKVLQKHSPDSNNSRVLFFELLERHEYFLKFILTDKNGYVVNVFPHDEDLLGMDMSGRAFFKEVMTSAKNYWSSVFISSPHNIPVAALSLPFGEGIITAHLNLTRLSEITGKLSETEKIIVSVTDQTGTYLSHSNEKNVLQREMDPNYNRLKKMYQGEIFGIDMMHNSMKFTCHVGFVRQTGWSVMISQPFEKSYMPVKRISWIILSATVFIFLFSFLVSFRYATKITKAFNKFLASLRTIARGDYDTRVTGIQYSEFIEFSDNVERMARKIKERKKRILESQRMFRAVFNADAVGTSIVDRSGTYQMVNDKWTEITGYSMSDLSEHTNLSITHPEDRKMMEAFLQGVYDGSRLSGRLEKRIIRKDGVTLWVDNTMAIIEEDNDFRYIVGMLVDNTDRKKAEEERRQLESKLQHAFKMEAVGSLAGGIAHDFNNILAAILGYTDLAKDDTDKNSQVAGYLDQIMLAGNRAKDLVRQILTFSRQSDTGRTTFKLEKVIEEAIKMLRPSIPTSIEIHQEIDSDIGYIFANPSKLHQVLINLCTNSFQSMEEEGGMIEISLKKKSLSAEDLRHIPGVKAGSFACLIVKDSGPGIPPQVREKIFDPYFTTKDFGKGTGMGLSIVHGIVSNYGGFITLDEKTDKGATFLVFLPIVEKDVDQSQMESSVIPTGEESILFVDDEEVIVNMGKSMLEKLGYTVTASTSSREALDLFKQDPEKFDLVITDQTMPGMTGAELSVRLLEIRPDIPIIMCSGYSSVISEEKAMAIGVKKFALKPLTKKDLTRLVRTVLAQK